jgi:hypothetical protein
VPSHPLFPSKERCNRGDEEPALAREFQTRREHLRMDPRGHPNLPRPGRLWANSSVAAHFIAGFWKRQAALACRWRQGAQEGLRRPAANLPRRNGFKDCDSQLSLVSDSQVTAGSHQTGQTAAAAVGAGDSEGVCGGGDGSLKASRSGQGALADGSSCAS